MIMRLISSKCWIDNQSNHSIHTHTYGRRCWQIFIMFGVIVQPWFVTSSAILILWTI